MGSGTYQSSGLIAAPWSREPSLALLFRCHVGLRLAILSYKPCKSHESEALTSREVDIVQDQSSVTSATQEIRRMDGPGTRLIVTCIRPSRRRGLEPKVGPGRRIGRCGELWRCQKYSGGLIAISRLLEIVSRAWGHPDAEPPVLQPGLPNCFCRGIRQGPIANGSDWLVIPQRDEEICYHVSLLHSEAPRELS